MTNLIARREILRHLVVFPVGAAVAAGLAACSKKPQCDSVGSLSHDDLTLRKDTAAYAEKSPDAAKTCAKCVQFVPASANACGTCKVIKGPINPEGTCKLFAANSG